MFKKTVEYTDFNGNTRKEDFYFHFSEAELLEMEYSVHGGLQKTWQKIIDTQDIPELMQIFKRLVLESYGEKSADGRQFNKSKELSEAFSHTEAYNIIYTELATDDKAAAEFFTGILPSKLQPEVKKEYMAAINTEQ